MAQTDQRQDVRDGMAQGPAVAGAVLQQMETWARTQCEPMSGVEAICSRWLQWQREAIDASARSLAEISKSRDLGNILQIQQQWFADAVRRTTSNWSELANDAAMLTWQVPSLDRKSDQIHNAAPRTLRESGKDGAPMHREAAE